MTSVELLDAETSGTSGPSRSSWFR
ncbi:HPP family protein, partial [Enterobacteriaceae bacterium TzEc051]